MDIQRLSLKWGGLTNVLGGILVALAYVLHPHHQTPEVISSHFWFVIHIIFALSLLFGIFGLMSVFQRHISKSSISGFIGFILATISLVGIFGLNYYEAFINPVVAREAAEFVTQYGAGTGIGSVAYIFPASGLCFLIGYSMLCYDIIRVRSLDSGAARLTFAGTVVFGVGLSGYLPMIVVQLGAVLFGAGLVWLGAATIKVAADVGE